MDDIKYPEVEKLKALQDTFKISVNPIQKDFLSADTSYKRVILNIAYHKFDIYVSDEYDDLDESNQLLSICLVLRELEEYQNSKDFLEWARHNQLNPSANQVRQYHMSLRSTYFNIEMIIGKIDSFISDLDFELNSGAAQWLRINGNQCKLRL